MEKKQESDGGVMTALVWPFAQPHIEAAVRRQRKRTATLRQNRCSASATARFS